MTSEKSDEKGSEKKIFGHVQSNCSENVIVGSSEQKSFVEALDARTNSSDGSLRHFQNTDGKLPSDWEMQNQSLELVNGDITISRTRLGSESALLGYPAENVLAQNFQFPDLREMYRKGVEHKYRGKELETMRGEIPEKSWDDALRAFPELSQLGEKNAKKLMKAIVANELEHYDPGDLGQDIIARTGFGGSIHGKTVGYAQLTSDGVRKMSAQFDEQVRTHHRKYNPLENLAKLDENQLVHAVAKPANVPLMVAAHLAIDLRTLNNHKNELSVCVEALGYIYNADMVYAKTDTNHKHLLFKKYADKNNIPNVFALPTEDVLRRSEHAANIRKWLGRIK